MKNRIVLNCFPPADISSPSASMSVLQSYLIYNNFSATTIYWNFIFSELQCSFLWADDPKTLGDEINSLLLFFNYIAIKNNDKDIYNSIKSKLMSKKPHYINEDSTIFDRHMVDHAEKLDKLISDKLSAICEPDISCYAMSMSMYQWVCASIIAKKIKEKYPQSLIVIGGIGTKHSAQKFLENFEQFDFAIWGEGENPLMKLCDCLNVGNVNDNLYENIPHLIYRKGEHFIVTENVTNEYSDLSNINIKPTYSNYFEQKNKHPKLKNIKSVIGIEASRSCHWKKCHFCYLNKGYKYRVKPVLNVVNEILFCIKHHKVYEFTFLDNDLISNDLQRFDELLDKLIEIKARYPDFSIRMAEIITFNINVLSLRKMIFAGFSHIQIGYESLSNNLLKKIGKKNTFASNLLVIKFCSVYKICVEGANIIMGLLEETNDDIIECIENIVYLRFFLNNNTFRHSYTTLSVAHSSPYFKNISENKNLWIKGSYFRRFLSSSYLLGQDDEADIIEYQRQNNSPMWEDFRSIEYHYLENNYAYQLINTDMGILYKEYVNMVVVKEIYLEYLECCILKSLNEVILSIDALLENLRVNFRTKHLDLEIMNTLENLKTERLIYISSDYSEIISVVNTNYMI